MDITSWYVALDVVTMRLLMHTRDDLINSCIDYGKQPMIHPRQQQTVMLMVTVAMVVQMVIP
jgi:hypothetical protein